MLDLATTYEETQRTLADLAGSLGDEDLSSSVPGSPEWSVKDVVAHVTGIAVDISKGSIPPELDIVRALSDPEQAAIRDEMTARQVAARRDLSLVDILGEWREAMPALLSMIRGERPFPQPVPFADAVVVTDLGVHTQDVRGALGRPGDRDAAAVGVGLAAYAVALGFKLAAAGLPPLRLRYGDRERVAGEGEPRATVSADRFEIFRALAGRRSRDQILAMEWQGDPEPYLDLIPAYGPRADAVIE